MTKKFVCPLCHPDYCTEVFETDSPNEYWKHLRDVHKTTCLNIERVERAAIEKGVEIGFGICVKAGVDIFNWARRTLKGML